MSHQRRLQTRRIGRNPHAYDPIEHNEAIARRKARIAHHKRWQENLRRFNRTLRGGAAAMSTFAAIATKTPAGFASGGFVNMNPDYIPVGTVHRGSLTIARKVEPGTPEHAALTAQMRERFPDSLPRVRRQEVEGRFAHVDEEPARAPIWFGDDEALGRKSDYQLASGGPA